MNKFPIIVLILLNVFNGIIDIDWSLDLYISLEMARVEGSALWFGILRSNPLGPSAGCQIELNGPSVELACTAVGNKRTRLAHGQLDGRCKGIEVELLHLCGMRASFGHLSRQELIVTIMIM